MSALSAARGVSQVMNRCEDAKSTGFLDLSECELMYIADALYMVLSGYEITRCSLKNNKLKKFPTKMIKNFPNMDVFNLEGNQITELPIEISKWTKLRGINIAKNKFTQFPEQLFECKKLALLDISGNLINEINHLSLRSSLSTLKQLHMRQNPICQSQEIIEQICAELEPIKVLHK
ncbi:hypothetical protein ACQ4LE_010830 [Meloidogyne hapla]|uniref:Leucine Rich repeat-containing domain protein n=1 Tax=Meloidogyne hapla TaxID=6305 RepID=A0A1I8B6C6_MELHA